MTIREITGEPKQARLQRLGGELRELLADGYARGGPSNFGVTERGVQGLFYDALDQLVVGGGSWARAASLFFPQSNVLTEKHRWLGAVPKPREHEGGRQGQPLANFSLDVVNRDFELSMPISLHDWRRDKTGQLARKASEFAAAWEDHWIDLAVECMEDNDTAYDGAALYSASHSSGSSGTLKNLLTATEVPALNVAATGAPTVDEAAAIMAQMSSYMYTYKDDQGRVTNQSARRFMFVVPAAVCAPFEQAVALPLHDGGGTNPLRGLRREFVVVPEARLTSNTLIYCFILDRPQSGALIMQQDRDPMVNILGETSEHALKSNEILYLSSASRAVAPGQWRETARGLLS